MEDTQKIVDQRPYNLRVTDQSIFKLISDSSQMDTTSAPFIENGKSIAKKLVEGMQVINIMNIPTTIPTNPIDGYISQMQSRAGTTLTPEATQQLRSSLEELYGLKGEPSILITSNGCFYNSISALLLSTTLSRFRP